MGWREYLKLFLKYEGDLNQANERELEHANRGMDTELAKRLALADYKRRERKERIAKNGGNKNNNKNQETPVSDKCFADSLF